MGSIRKLFLTAAVDFVQAAYVVRILGVTWKHEVKGGRSVANHESCIVRIDVMNIFRTRIPEEVAFRVRGGRTNLLQDGKPHRQRGTYINMTRSALLQLSWWRTCRGVIWVVEGNLAKADPYVCRVPLPTPHAVVGQPVLRSRYVAPHHGSCA